MFLTASLIERVVGVKSDYVLVLVVTKLLHAVQTAVICICKLEMLWQGFPR
ncbi:hypothetical protein D3C80_2111570 [compost metagenome]